jgi:hypothetical protein
MALQEKLSARTRVSGTGANVMITNFGDCYRFFSEKKMAFLTANVVIQFLHNLSVPILVQKRKAPAKNRHFEQWQYPIPNFN